MTGTKTAHETYLEQASGLISIPGNFTTGKTGWKSPSNIALVKYWGKKEKQVPTNPSLSLTLKNSYTHTEVIFSRKTDSGISFSFYFGEEKKPGFEPKIQGFLENVSVYLPFLRQMHLQIKSHNSFPHSAGIASSASAMSALALCLCDMEEQLFGPVTPDEKLRKASFMARIGSGSACRSIYPGFVSWGKAGNLVGSTDEYANPLTFKIHENFRELEDTILITDPGTKKISSTAGHGMMKNHPYAESRYRQAGLNHLNLRNALATGNSDEFTMITETEALSLHSLMMSSSPGYFLINSQTLEIIRRIREFRDENKVFICFTLDAGPNVHVIHGKPARAMVMDFIRNELSPLCYENMTIFDGEGRGPERIQ